ncbi:MAG: hypothetical protein ACYC1S_10980 [Gemmatimonadaceae bacterium]
MFAGHTAFALLARRARPTIPFAALFVAAYAPDFVEMVLRTHYGRGLDPVLWSHSWPAVGAQAAVAGLVVLTLWRDARGAGIAALAVLSHWPADVLTGIDKPTWPGGPVYGLYLYDRHAADFLVETGLLLAGWWVARRTWPGLQRLATAAVVGALIAVQGLYAARGDGGMEQPTSGKANLLHAIRRAVQSVVPR